MPSRGKHRGKAVKEGETIAGAIGDNLIKSQGKAPWGRGWIGEGRKKTLFSPSRPPPLKSALRLAARIMKLVPAASRGFSLAWLLAFTKSFACQTNYATDKPRERLRKKDMQERKNLCSQSRKLARIRGGGPLGIIWVGMCRPGLQIGTPF